MQATAGRNEAIEVTESKSLDAPKIFLPVPSNPKLDVRHGTGTGSGVPTTTDFQSEESSEGSSSFHVFTWPERTKSSQQNTRPDASAIPEDLSGPIQDRSCKDLIEIEQFIQHRVSLARRMSYRNCSKRSRQQVLSDLAKCKPPMTDAGERLSALKEYGNKVDIINDADTVFNLFLPPEAKGPTTEEFWGAVDERMKV